MPENQSSANESKKRPLSLSLTKKKKSSQSGSSHGPLKQTQIQLQAVAKASMHEQQPSSPPPPPRIASGSLSLTLSSLNMHQQQEPQQPPPPQQQQPISPLLGDYVCPICQHDLGNVKSRFLRQRHVEACLDTTTTTTDDSKTAEPSFDEFAYCLFCGKNITHLEGWRKDAHFSRCMDAYIEDENNSNSNDDPMSFIGQLEICPSCHEFGPFGRQRTARKKIQHLKQCAKGRHMSMQQLLQKLKWIAWGHVPVERQRAPPQAAGSHPTERPPALISATALVEDDHDFSSVVLLHKRTDLQHPRKKPRKEEDDNNNDLALAIALSLSEDQPPPPAASSSSGPPSKSSKRQGPSDAALILSVEESRHVVKRELATLLFAEEQSPGHNRYCIEPLPPSRLLSQARIGSSGSSGSRQSLWELAAMQHIDDDSGNQVYQSNFLQ